MSQLIIRERECILPFFAFLFYLGINHMDCINRHSEPLSSAKVVGTLYKSNSQIPAKGHPCKRPLHR